MKPIDHILVPTDFSMHSKAALEEACGLAQRLGASIDLLYVWPGSHPVACEIFDHVTDDHGGELARFAQTLEGRELEALMRITRDYGVCVRGRLEAGDAARAILAVAERDGHDLIVMG